MCIGPKIIDGDETRRADKYEVFHESDLMESSRVSGYAFFSPISYIHDGFSSFADADAKATEFMKFKA